MIPATLREALLIIEALELGVERLERKCRALDAANWQLAVTMGDLLPDYKPEKERLRLAKAKGWK